MTFYADAPETHVVNLLNPSMEKQAENRPGLYAASATILFSLSRVGNARARNFFAPANVISRLRGHECDLILGECVI